MITKSNTRKNLCKKVISFLLVVCMVAALMIPAMSMTVSAIGTNDTSYPFTVNGNIIQSTNKSNSSSSTYTYVVDVAGTYDLKYKVSSESGFDFLTINHNNTQLVRASGTYDWTTVSVTVAAGDIITVTYSKDGSVSSGSDCGWVDFSDFAVTPAPTPTPDVATGKILVVQNGDPWGENSNTDVMTALRAGGYITGYDIVTTSGFASVDLSDYSVIYVVTSGSVTSASDANSIYDRVLAFANAGGTVIYGVAWMGQYTMSLPLGVSVIYGSYNYNSIENTSHPIIAGTLTGGNATIATPLYGNSISHSYIDNTTLPAGANVILTSDSNGKPTLAEYACGEGNVIISCLTWECFYDNSLSSDRPFASTYYDDLFVYALSLAGENVQPPVAETPSDVWNGSVAGNFGGGSGTAENPYLIYTGAQLAYLAQQTNNGTTFEGCYFKLMNNIDLGNVEWTPIGIGTNGDYFNSSTTYTFRGTFDGNGYVISNMKITNTHNGNIGLFGIINGGSVYNLGVANVDINVTFNQSEYELIGALAGIAYGQGSVENCFTTGSISGRNEYNNSWDMYGGLIGAAYQTAIKNCYSECDLSIYTRRGGNFGGLIGCAAAITLENSYASGDLNFTSTSASTPRVAGLIGCASTQNGRSNIVNCFATGNVNSVVASDMGYLFGYIAATITNCYSSSSQVLSGSASDSGKHTSVSAASFASYAWISANLGWDLASVWQIPADAEAPTLRGFGEGGATPPATDTSSELWDGTIAAGFGGGSGTAENPYLICTGAQLAYLAQQTNNGTTFEGCYFKLMNNIDLGNVEWTPIGKGILSTSIPLTTNVFKGHFDGNYKIISNLSITNNDTTFTGLFGTVVNGSVSNLGIENATISIYVNGRSKVGALVGTISGAAISNCYVTGANISNRSSEQSSAACLIGLSSAAPSTITNCYAQGTVESGKHAAIILGGIYTNGSVDITNCYAVGSATGYHVGSMIGYNNDTQNPVSTITNCFFSGTVSSTQSTKGTFYGDSDKTSVVNSYYSCTGAGKYQGTSTDAANFASQAWIASNLGWDFTYIWEMPAGAAAPTLRGFGEGGATPPPSACEHEYTHIENNATCTTAGESKDVCALCGNVANYVYIPSLGHSYASEVTREATCYEDGIITYTCINNGCGNSYDVTVHVEHNYVVSVVDPTCTVDGATIYTCTLCGDVNAIAIPAAHNYVSQVTKPATRDEDGEITYTCSACGHSYIEVIPASNANILVIQDKIPWGVNNIPTLLNDMKSKGYIDGWSLTTTANITSLDLSLFDVILVANDQTTATYNQLRVLDGLLTAFASAGGTVIYGACDNGWSGGRINFDILGSIEKTEFYSMHNYIVDATHPIVTGSLTDDKAITNDLLVGTYCSHSGFRVDTLPAGYNIILQDGQGNATLAEYPLGEGRVILSGLTWEFYYSRIYTGHTSYSMNVFDDLIAYAVNPGNVCAHRYDAGTVVEATCETEGYTLHVCSECGATYKDNYVAALGHEMGEWTVDRAPDCLNNGLQHQVCSRCDETVEAVIPTVGHTAGEWYLAVEATCAEGRRYRECSVCHTIMDIEMIPAVMEHTPSGWITDIAATCLEGSKHKECTVCGDILETAEIAPATGHTPGIWIVDVRPTDTNTGLRHRNCTVCGAECMVQTMPILATFTIADVEAKAGSIVRVTIDVQNNPGIIGALLTIEFDPALTLIGAEAGGAWNTLNFTKPAAFSNSCNFVWDGVAGADYGNGTIIVLTFAVPAGVEFGTVYDISASYLPNNMINANLEPMDIAIVDGSITVGNAGGDVNADGVVDVLDVIILRRYLAGGYDVVIDDAASDMDSDGYITVADLILLRRQLVG